MNGVITLEIDVYNVYRLFGNLYKMFQGFTAEEAKQVEVITTSIRGETFDISQSYGMYKSPLRLSSYSYYSDSTHIACGQYRCPADDSNPTFTRINVVLPPTYSCSLGWV